MLDRSSGYDTLVLVVNTVNINTDAPSRTSCRGRLDSA